MKGKTKDSRGWIDQETQQELPSVCEQILKGQPTTAGSVAAQGSLEVDDSTQT